MKPYKTLVFVMCLALMLSACGRAVQPVTTEAGQPPAIAATAEPAAEEGTPAATDQTAETEPHGLRPDAPPYAVRGPYAVGVRQFEIAASAENERPLNLTVWYPALNPEGAEEAASYTMDFLADPATGFPTSGRALRDAAPDSSGGAYPLVLYSHGAWCFPAIGGFFTEHLASHGFVVMAAVHEDNWGTLGEPTYKSEISRPKDMVSQLDFAEDLTAPTGDMAGLIDMEHVAATGQSFGGQIALELGGARLNTAEWQETYCADFPEDEDCKAYPDHLEEMADLAGLEAVPEGLWPDWSDPRVDVVVATAPAVSMLGGGGLEGVRRPTMLLIGTNDTWVGPAHEYRKFYESLPASDKTRVLFEGADHMIFGNACPAYPGMVDAGFYFVCADSVWDMDRAHDLTNHFVTAFLLSELKGDAEAAAALAPENVSFPGISYETTAYGTATAEAVTPPKPHGLRFDAPPYALSGPYGVGVRYFTIPAETDTDRALTATVWYPAVVPGDAPATIVYEQHFEPGQIPPFTVIGHALLDAPPDDSAAPYPLVVYTHAHWSYGQELAYLTEHLASQGFVVISVDHEDNWSTDFGPMAYEALVHRPQEVTREIDFAEGLSAPDGSLPGMIAAQQVGITGWSIGGVTSLAAAGARMDLANLRDWCKVDPSHEAAVGWACVDILDHEAEMADFAGLSEVPTGLWPDWSDDRIAAVMLLSGSSPIFGSKGVESVDVPVLVMHGGGEAATDPAVEMGNPYGSVSSDHKAQVVFDDAGHALFFSSCAESPSVLELSQAIGFPTFCADPVWDKDRAHDLINHFATAFLLAELKGDAEAATALAPEKVSFTGIEYQAMGYEATAGPEVFVRGAALPGPMDIAIGPDGLAYVASELGRSIVVVDPTSGEIVRRIGRNDGIDALDALTVGPDGSIYWSSFYTLELCRLSPSNEKACQSMPVDTWGMALSPNGRLFATADEHVASLYEVDPLLQSPPRLTKPLGSLISHFTFGPDGKLYAPLLMEGTIVRVDVDTDPVQEETVAEGLTLPWALAFDSTGQLYAATSLDAQNNVILRVDPATGASEEIGKLPAGYNTIAITKDDRILSAHFDEGNIAELMPDGNIRPLTQPGMIAPGGLAVRVRSDGGESVFVAGWKSLHEFDGATGEQRNVWRTGWFPDMVVPPRTVALDGENLLVTAWADEWGGDAVQIWDPEAGKPVAVANDFVWPANAIHFQGDVIVVEMPADAPWRVVRTDGDDMATRREIGGSILKQPLGLAADEDNLWVTDYEAGRVVQVVADGVELEEPVVIASDLNHPEGIAIAPDGRLLLAETGTGRLLAIEASTGNADVIAEGLDFMQDNPTSIGPVSLPPQYIFSGVAVGPSGNVYVSGDGANVIYRILLGEPQSLDAELIAKIEALVEQEMADKDIPGVSLGIVKDGQVAYAKGFGVAERDTDRAMTPQTQFPVACITKGFTTAAIMQLVEQGLVDLDAPVTDYLPYFKLADERYKEITIHHLLANTAGLPMPDYVTLYGGFSHNPSWSPDLLEKYVRSLADKPMATDPADNIFMYGGDYFDILGDVIAKVSGQPFEEYMDQYILQPLGLEHTTFIVDELDPELAAAAYWQDENGEMQVSVPSPTYYPAHTPSNGMFSTTEDLLKWAIFNLNRGELDGRQIVPASAYDEMWKPQTEIPWGGIYQHWGYGWGISDLEDHRLVFWGGGHIGAPTAYYLAPDENLAVYVAANRSLEAVKGTEYADEIAFPIVEMLLGINGSEETK